MEVEDNGKEEHGREEIATHSRPMVPTDANVGCPGVLSSQAGKKASTCDGCPNQGKCASGSAKTEFLKRQELISERLSQVKHKIVVLSGKGGVGKSTIAVSLAQDLASRGYQVGVLDIDICGPSIPMMLGVSGMRVHQSNYGWEPVINDDGILVMSVGFLLENADDAVVWRGPRKDGLIEQFLKTVNWGSLDFLIIDTPPGTSDEHISLAQHLSQASIDGAVVVSTPQAVAIADVRKEIRFCEKVGIHILGVIENMRGLTAELPEIDSNIQMKPTPETMPRLVDVESGEDVTIDVMSVLKEKFPNRRFGIRMDILPCQDGVRDMCEEMDVRHLGSLAFDPNVARQCDEGSKHRRPCRSRESMHAIVNEV
eukprot:CAMPEP_0170174104 /NCGR_PEP_ID=MMETSP0040_2-20121228/7360_1 /TAXON_ID=641309 /ORGANISM="Lotharella oceanica, Strain CCMP622" /LENGTH=368 /DNA_ID=CAMNT_0010415599 /DNA_START=224 /DNA_END=1327 /DNA_ORIENTATION=-